LWKTGGRTAGIAESRSVFEGVSKTRIGATFERVRVVFLKQAGQAVRTLSALYPTRNFGVLRAKYRAPLDAAYPDSIWARQAVRFVPRPVERVSKAGA